MPEQRCPMCSKPNPEDADECIHCGARLTPLVISSDQPESTRDESQSEAPDWLSRIRSDVQASQEPEPAEVPEGEQADWLGRLRSASDDDQPSAQPEAAVPDWVDTRSPDESIDEKVPEWLSRIRSKERKDKDESPEEPSGERQDWLQTLRDKTGEEAPRAAESEPEGAADWLTSLRSKGAEEEPAAPTPEPPLQDLRDVLPPEDIPPAEPAIPSEPVAAAEPDEEPEDDSSWLAAFEEAAGQTGELASSEAEPEAGILSSDDDDWLSDFEAAAQLPADAPSEEPGALPGGFRPVELDLSASEPEDASDDEIFEALEALEGQGPISSEPTLETPFEGMQDVEWLEQKPTEEEAPEAPAYPEEPISQHTPPLIFDDQAVPTEIDSQELEIEAIDLPAWLGELQKPSEDVAPETLRERPDLAPATLPAWLEAMRPIETFRSSVEIEPEVDQSVESTGPLAGLRGVLMAEPVVAIPHQATVGTGRLDISERQYAQAELLHRMVDDEEREVSLESTQRRRLPFLRWIISALLIVAIGFSIGSTGPGETLFALPERVPQDLGPLFALVDGLSTDQPVLLVFDYPPGYTGEFDAVANVILEHLMRREIAIATVSTQVTGPLLAERALARAGIGHDLVNGSDYIHLGYLSGGPTAVQLFSAAPREAILSGFLLPDELDGQTAWLSSILRDVQRLSDFGMVAVITAGTDNARIWAEQAHPWMGDTPLVMVLSAGAEPLVRPYYESLEPQVDGILTGLPEAVAYEQLNARPADAIARWDGFNAGMLVVEAVLLAGILYGLVQWLLKPRRS